MLGSVGRQSGESVESVYFFSVARAVLSRTLAPLVYRFFAADMTVRKRR